jgi:two-component system sensor histidine kinase KdpD
MFEAGARRSGSGPAPQTDQVPSVVRDAILALLEERSGSDAAPFVDDAIDTGWLIRGLSQRNSVLGILAIEIGPVAQDNREATRQRIDAALAEASATLERIDVANAINDANLRIQTDTLREALIGSVSHELRTPLASIIGSTSILAGTPAIVQDPRLAALAGVVREEAERLDGDIQNLLNASRISGSGVRPHLEWSDPADIINAAVERHRRRLGAQSVEVQMPDDLPLVHVDSILIEQALGQVVDNAIKYSAPDTTVRITAYCGDNEIAIVVEDRGSGLTGEEQDRIWERFYRGSRHAGSVPGSGLGMWIAQSFVQACGGSLEAVSAGIGQGTKVTLRLAAARQPDLASAGAADD